jgi:hypothetical protein
MKSIPWIVAALVFGLVLGEWAPRGDLRQARQEIAALKAELKQKTRRRSGLEGIAAILPMPGKIVSAPHGKSGPTPQAAAATATRPVADTASHLVQTKGPKAPDTPPTDKARLAEQLRDASNLWRTRVDLARSSFVSNVLENKDEEEFFDLVIETMNARLTESIRRWTDTLKRDQTVTPESGIRMTNELTDALVQTYDELDQTLPEGWRAKAGEGFQLFDFIDPQVATPLAEVEDILAQSGPGEDGSADATEGTDASAPASGFSFKFSTTETSTPNDAQKKE